MPTSSPTRVAARLSLLTLWPWALGLLLVNTVGLFWVVLVEASHTGIHHDNTQATLLALSVVTALVLGFRGWFDGFSTDGWALLAHQPVSRTNVFVSRVCVGLGLHLAVLLPPWLAVTAFHATPGMVAAPYFLEMTGVGLVWIFTGVPLYLAAVVTVFGEARWIGPRSLWPAVALATFVPMQQSVSPLEAIGWIVAAVGLIAAAAWLGLRARGTDRGRARVATRWLDRLVLTSACGLVLVSMLCIPAVLSQWSRGLGAVARDTPRSLLGSEYDLRNDGEVTIRLDTGRRDEAGDRVFAWTDLMGEPTAPADHVSDADGSIFMPTTRDLKHRGLWSDLRHLYEEVRTQAKSRIYADFRRGVVVAFAPDTGWRARPRVSMVTLPGAEGEPAEQLRQNGPALGGRTIGTRGFQPVGGNTPSQGVWAVHVEQGQLLAEDVARVATGVIPRAVDRLIQQRMPEDFLRKWEAGGPRQLPDFVAIGERGRVAVKEVRVGGAVRTLVESPPLQKDLAFGRVEIVRASDGTWAFLRQPWKKGEAAAWWSSDGSQNAPAEWRRLPPLAESPAGLPARSVPVLKWLPTLVAPWWSQSPHAPAPLRHLTPWPNSLLLGLTLAAAFAGWVIARCRRLCLHAGTAAAGGVLFGPAFPLALLLERKPRTVAETEPKPPRSAATRLVVPA